MRLLLLVTGLPALLWAGCGYQYFASQLRPMHEQGPAMTVADDGSITYARDRFEVRLRPLTDEELNRQFASHSESGRESTNPYTFGDTQFWEDTQTRQRFTVFHLNVKNYAFPKVKLDPARVELRADNGRQYWSLNVRQLDNYYRIYAIGYRGNTYARYRERIDLLLQTLFKGEEIFSGQEAEGYLVFPLLHPDVQRIEVVIHDAMLRFDYRNEPVETADITYQFERDVGRRYYGGTREFSATN